MCGIDPIFARPDFRLWLQGDIQPPEIDVCLYEALTVKAVLFFVA